MEKNLKTCKVCNETKLNILDKTYNYKNKRYVDENGQQWSGKVCPKCHAARMKIRMKSMRSAVKT